MVLIMSSSWKRALFCSYFRLLGKYAWLKFANNRLRALLFIELRKYQGQSKGLFLKERIIRGKNER